MVRFLRRRKKKEKSIDDVRSLPGAGDDMLSYKNMILTESRWANTGSGWRMVDGWIITGAICIGGTVLLLVLQRGWDGLFQLLGWK